MATRAKKSVKKTAGRMTAARSKVQGEGDYEAGRRYRQRVEKFVATSDIGGAARRAAPRSRAEAESLRAAESAGRRRAKGEDPALRRRGAPRVEPSTRGRTSRH
jgi:hypothetical protein